MTHSLRRAIVNARVATGDPKRPWADAVLLEGDRVVMVGSSAAIRKLTGPETIVVDANGATVTVVDGRVVSENKTGPGP